MLSNFAHIHRRQRNHIPLKPALVFAFSLAIAFSGHCVTVAQESDNDNKPPFPSVDEQEEIKQEIFADFAARQKQVKTVMMKVRANTFYPGKTLGFENTKVPPEDWPDLDIDFSLAYHLELQTRKTRIEREIIFGPNSIDELPELREEITVFNGEEMVEYRPAKNRKPGQKGGLIDVRYCDLEKDFDSFCNVNEGPFYYTLGILIRDDWLPNREMTKGIADHFKIQHIFPRKSPTSGADSKPPREMLLEYTPPFKQRINLKRVWRVRLDPHAHVVSCTFEPQPGVSMFGASYHNANFEWQKTEFGLWLKSGTIEHKYDNGKLSGRFSFEVVDIKFNQEWPDSFFELPEEEKNIPGRLISDKGQLKQVADDGETRVDVERRDIPRALAGQKVPGTTGVVKQVHDKDATWLWIINGLIVVLMVSFFLWREKKSKS